MMYGTLFMLNELYYLGILSENVNTKQMTEIWSNLYSYTCKHRRNDIKIKIGLKSQHMLHQVVDLNLRRIQLYLLWVLSKENNLNKSVSVCLSLLKDFYTYDADVIFQFQIFIFKILVRLSKRSLYFHGFILF